MKYWQCMAMLHIIEMCAWDHNQFLAKEEEGSLSLMRHRVECWHSIPGVRCQQYQQRTQHSKLCPLLDEVNISMAVGYAPALPDKKRFHSKRFLFNNIEHLHNQCCRAKPTTLFYKSLATWEEIVLEKKKKMFTSFVLEQRMHASREGTWQYPDTNYVP